LLSLKTILKNVATNTVIDRHLGKLRAIDIHVICNVLKDIGTTVKDVLLVKTLDLQSFINFIFLPN
jgi:hypothetical protein